jgi:hypothetical protein
MSIELSGKFVQIARNRQRNHLQATNPLGFGTLGAWVLRCCPVSVLHKQRLVRIRSKCTADSSFSLNGVSRQPLKCFDPSLGTEWNYSC